MKKIWEEAYMSFILKGILVTAVACGLLIYLHRPVTEEVYWRVVLGTGAPALLIVFTLGIVLAVRSWKKP